MITQAELKENLHYDAETGVFTRRIALARRVQIGDVAGCKRSDGYISIRVCGKSRQAHRLAWLHTYGNWPKGEIDHINHIKDDNRIINLREVTTQENLRNSSKSIRNTSGTTGVSWNNQKQKWCACVGVDGKNVSAGCFSDKFEAVCARKSAENKYGFHENHGTVKL